MLSRKFERLSTVYPALYGRRAVICSSITRIAPIIFACPGVSRCSAAARRQSDYVRFFVERNISLRHMGGRLDAGSLRTLLPVHDLYRGTLQVLPYQRDAALRRVDQARPASPLSVSWPHSSLPQPARSGRSSQQKTMIVSQGTVDALAWCCPRSPYGSASVGRRPQAPMYAKPQPRKSASSSLASSLASSAAVITPEEINGAAMAATLSR